MILVFIEQERTKVNEASFEGLTLGRALAQQTNVPLHALVIGAASAELVERVGAYGASVLNVAESEALNEYAPDAVAACLVEIARGHDAKAVLASASERGNDIMARVAAKMNLPFAANVVSVQTGEAFFVTRQRWGGSLLEDAELSGATKLLSLAPNAVPAARAENPSQVTVQVFAPTLEANDLRVRVTRRIESASGQVSLGEAKFVVGGGRGVGSAEGFASLQELANLLGGAVGGSRAVTSLGWRAHADQIGQTGNRIAPELYIACGVSGAIQHMIGCKGAKHILAINTDPQAPILSKADYAVIGDLHKVVPAISAEIRKRRS